MNTKCEILHCHRPAAADIEYRPPGHALHEGTFRYFVCKEHRSYLLLEPGYWEVA